MAVIAATRRVGCAHQNRRELLGRAKLLLSRVGVSSTRQEPRPPGRRPPAPRATYAPAMIGITSAKIGSTSSNAPLMPPKTIAPFQPRDLGDSIIATSSVQS